MLLEPIRACCLVIFLPFYMLSHLLFFLGSLFQCFSSESIIFVVLALPIQSLVLVSIWPLAFMACMSWLAPSSFVLVFSGVQLCISQPHAT